MIDLARRKIGTQTYQSCCAGRHISGVGGNSMASNLADFGRNAILACLKGKERALAFQEGEIIDFKVRQTVYRPDQHIHEAYFPLGAILSVVARMKGGEMIEIGTIGREGTSALPLVMGSDTSSNESFCQVPGKAWKMSTETFRRLMAKSQVFRQFLNRFLQAYVNMLGQMAACNRMHSVQERCARWLLMSADRVGSNEFPLTHEFLAIMLGSRRSGVTVAASMLQKAGFIHYSHGTVTILDRAGLEAATCECYKVAADQFSGLLNGRPDANR